MGGSNANAFAFRHCAFGHSARVATAKGRAPPYCCNSGFSSESDTPNVDMKTGEGLSVTAGERRILSPTRSEHFNLWTAQFLPFEPFLIKCCYLEMALVALAECPRRMPRVYFPLDWTQYDMINEGTDIEIELHFEFCPHSPKPPAGRIRNLAKKH